MALQWSFKEKCGEVTMRNSEGQEWALSLYEGNALLIMLHEYEQDSGSYYNLAGFFADKTHMKRCLGLEKGYEENIYNTDASRITKLRLNKAKSHYVRDIVTSFAKAFDNITIEIYKED